MMSVGRGSHVPHFNPEAAARSYARMPGICNSIRTVEISSIPAALAILNVEQHPLAVDRADLKAHTASRTHKPAA
jgi:hypothetical protein